MVAKITRDVLESYVFCQYKSYLKLTGQHGAKSDYETLFTTFRSEVRLKAINRIIDQHQEHQVVRNTPLTTAVLKRGPLFVLEPTLEDDLISLSFDGLKRVPGPSKLEEFLYIPMLFHEGHQVRKEQRLLRQGKRAGQGTNHRSQALLALAIRYKRIYVFGTPELPNSPVHIYLDIESNPEAGFVYLIGLIVVENGAEKTCSFWADHKEQESVIFEQFVAEVTRHENFVVFCYGDYERAFLRRMRKVAKRKKPVDRILNALVNTLSVIYAHIYFPTYSN